MWFKFAFHYKTNKITIIFLQIDLNIRDSCGNTPLHIAIEHNSLDAVEYLLQK